MIETRAALDALDGILSVEGLDGVYVGPSDLSIALTNGANVEPRGAAVKRGARRVVERAKAHGKYAVMFCFDGADARAMQALGFQLCAISSDQTLLHAVAGANSPPRAPDELRDGRRHWKNRFEHQYIVSAGMAASGRCGGVQLMAADTRQNVHLWA